MQISCDRSSTFSKYIIRIWLYLSVNTFVHSETLKLYKIWQNANNLPRKHTTSFWRQNNVISTSKRRQCSLACLEHIYTIKAYFLMLYNISKVRILSRNPFKKCTGFWRSELTIYVPRLYWNCQLMVPQLLVYLTWCGVMMKPGSDKRTYFKLSFQNPPTDSFGYTVDSP